MAKLTANTIVVHPESGQPVLLAADGDLPDWAEGMVGDHLLEQPANKTAGASGRESSTASSSEAPKAPPRSGPGSGAPEWRSYASKVGVDVPADAERSDVIAALDAAGKPTK